MRNRSTQRSSLSSLIKIFDVEVLSVEEWDSLCAVDLENKEEAASRLCDFLLPEYREMDSNSQRQIRIDLDKLLRGPDDRLVEILDYFELPFGKIERPRKFFEYIADCINENRSAE